MIKNLNKICHQSRPEITVSVKNTSSTQLVPTITTYEKFQRYLMPNHEKKLLQTTLTTKL